MTRPAGFVTLRGGDVIRVEAIHLVLDLEARGVRLERAGEEILLHQPLHTTDEDRQALRTLKADVLKVLSYVESEQ